MGTTSILLADDSVTIQKVVGIIFGGEEYSLTVVGDGNAAISKAQEISPNVMLIDALMPGMSGYEVCESLRKIPSLSQVPILLMTGSFEPFDEAKAKQCGANDFITKPFESQQIIAKVQELIAGGGTSTSAPPVTSIPEAAPLSIEVPAEPVVEAPEALAAFSEPEAVAPVNQDDPWGAFTQEPASSASFAAPEPAFEQNSLADVQPAPFEAETVQSFAAPEPVVEHSHIGTSWVPVEEQTFEFQEKPEAKTDDLIGVSEIEKVVTKPSVPESFEPISDLPQTAPSAAFAAPAVAAAAPVALSEDQLKVALASASKEVIERVVWEVVPDLAEAMIKEAIRRIKEGA